MPEAPIRPSQSREGQDLGDEYLFYDRSSDEVHVLNTTAREIFMLCDGSRTEDEIVEVFADRYEIDTDKARSDVDETLQQLYELEVIRR